MMVICPHSEGCSQMECGHRKPHEKGSHNACENGRCSGSGLGDERFNCIEFNDLRKENDIETDNFLERLGILK